MMHALSKRQNNLQRCKLTLVIPIGAPAGLAQSRMIFPVALAQFKYWSTTDILDDGHQYYFRHLTGGSCRRNEIEAGLTVQLSQYNY